ncbi:ester cyclase [Haloarchaeobius baliensis]|uniref:ester cyclase n=1 Tax=Haloarchaeobius baliensis TaxID=1670458 RepID=UPI003F883AB8
MTEPERPSVAIACQGGGSHTAFTAGVLDRFLEEDDVGFDIAGISGTSGGAICAFATWVGLVRDGRSEARRLLAQVWDDIAAKGPFDEMLNLMGVGLVRAQSTGMPFPEFSPYDTPASDWGRDVLRETLEAVIEPDELATLLDRQDGTLPRLDIGAVDVQRGSFRTFNEHTVSHDAVLASAAVPNLFQAAPVAEPDGTTRYYWDGLFSQNPPLGQLFRQAENRHERADELWIVQINPQRTDEIPNDLEAIGDRRNELGGNLSVNQELRFIRRLNEWEATDMLADVYDPIEVKTVNLEEELASPGEPLDYATKLDRSQRFLDLLWNHGRQQADRFLAIERNRRRVHNTVQATWREAEVLAPDEWAVPSYEAHIPTSLVLLRDYMQGEPTEEQGTLDRDAAFTFANQIRDAIPDLEFEVEEMVAQPNTVAIRWEGTGTHTEPLVDIEPTDEEVTLSGMRIDHLEDGRLLDTWLLFEQWSLLRQLDVAEMSTPVSTVSTVAATPVVTQLSAPAENEALARTLIQEVWNEGDRDQLALVLDPDVVLHLDGETDLVGRDAYWEFVSRYRTSFPDLELTIEDVVSEGDKIVLRLRIRGTHEGTMMDVEPTGNRIDLSRMVIYHLEDGRIIETGIVEDTLGMLQQLGAVGPASAE